MIWVMSLGLEEFSCVDYQMTTAERLAMEVGKGAQPCDGDIYPRDLCRPRRT